MRTCLPPISLARSHRGITLMEVLIVMTLVGILAAVAIPRVKGSSDPYQAVDDARRLHAAMATARASAIATQRYYRMVLSSGGKWKIESQDPATLAWSATPDSGQSSGTVTMNNSPSGTIVFYPRGRVDNARVLRVNVNGHQQEMRILASGVVRW
jgi:prepilin-type N-terminal cleavage/methylation domain-containing protein